MSEEILAEYVDVLRRQGERYREVESDPLIRLIVKRAVFVEPISLPGPVCSDPDDEKFFAAALGGNAKAIVSGDQHLIEVSGYQNVEVIRPADFVAQFREDR